MQSTLLQQQMAALQMKDNIASGAEMVLQSLLAEGITTIFGYPGGAVIPLYDALYDYQDKLHHILVRHEQGAIHAAQGYARATGRTGVVFATSGPGATNLVTGLADAFMDNTPVVCITGQVFASLLGTDAFQEADVMSITAPVTKWNCQVTDAADIMSTLAKAFYLAASGRPGPVLIDITKDALLQNTPQLPYVQCRGVRSYRQQQYHDDGRIAQAVQLINSARKPLVLLGQGVQLGNAQQEFQAFIEQGALPTAWTILGASVLPSGHRLNTGMLGMHGNYGPNLLTSECDVLIAVGMRFDDRVTGRLDKYAPRAKVIHIDIDPSEIGKNVAVTVGLCGDCKEILPLLTKQLRPHDRSEWLQRFADAVQIERAEVMQKELYASTEDITMAEVVRNLNELTHGHAVIVTDVGQHQMVACRYARFEEWRSNITSGGLGTMGFALPAAIGAAVGVPHRAVIAIAGDGGFQMNIQELGTIMEQGLPVKIIILNNGVLGMVRQWQEMFHNQRYSAVSMCNPDFVTIAKGYGIAAASVVKREQLHEALHTMLAHKSAYLLEVLVESNAKVFPMVPQGAGVSEIRLS